MQKHFFVLLLIFLFSSSAFSQQNNTVATVRSVEFALSAQAVDENIAIQIVEITEASLHHFYHIMGSSKEADVVCSYIWRDNPNQPIPDVYPCLLKIGKGFEIVGFGDLQNEKVREALIRTSMIVFLQSMVANEKKFQNGATIPYPSMWLLEGLTQGMFDDRGEKFEQIVQRAAAVKKTPSLKTIQQWEKFSSREVEKFWQQAFCYWLVDRATQSVPDQAKLCSWVRNKLSNSTYPDYWNHADENKWKRNQTPPDRSPMMTWEATCIKLDEILAEKDLGQQVSELMELQLRGHFLLQKVIDLYIAAFSLQGENRKSKLAEAKKQRVNADFSMQSARQRLDDILMNYAVSGEETKMLSEDEILEEYAHKPIDDVFEKRLKLYELKIPKSPRN